ncbi:MAG: hypothetical protein Q8R37_00810, partial [Nanoarchaeota archaeon]|nr:hypothetical protein [Nanoarchaeota archaeon]
MLEKKLEMINEELEKQDFISTQILQNVQHPGLFLSHDGEQKAAYLDQLFQTKGKEWVREAVHAFGFLVMDKNILLPVKMHPYLGRHTIFKNVEGNSFWHRDDVDQTDEFIDNPQEFIKNNKNPLRNYIYKKKNEMISVFHCP